MDGFLNIQILFYLPDIALCFRPNEQTYTTDAEATGRAKWIQTSSEADQSDVAATASLSPGPLMGSLGPVKVKTRTELPQSSKALGLITFHANVNIHLNLVLCQERLTWSSFLH